VIATAAFLMLNQQPAALQDWASGEWSRQDKAYSQILDEVRPFYGKNGFINEEVVSKKYIYHVGAYLEDRNNSILFMRALAWHEVALSDGRLSRRPDVKLLRSDFIHAMRMWSHPVNSFSFVRTMAICYLHSTSPDMFVDNRLIEKLYIKDPTDTELELAYLIWVSMNSEVAPNRLTIVKLLEKQERLQFRAGARLRALSMCYLFVSSKEPQSRLLVEKSISLMDKYLTLLPTNHYSNTPEYRKSVSDSKKELRRVAAKWKD